MADIADAKDATASIAQDKLNQKHRQKIWKWRCGVCNKRGNKQMKLKNSSSAYYHANNNPGHNVIVSYWTSEGEVFDHVTVKEIKQNLTDEPPF